MAPTVGRIVLVLVDPDTNNGLEVAPAIITRVWSGNDERALVNYRILGDHRPSEDEWKVQGSLYATQQAARDAMSSAARSAPKGLRAAPQWPHGYVRLLAGTLDPGQGACMSDQVIDLSAGAVEYTYPRTITETSGEDISADPVYVSLGSWTAPGVWVVPDSVTRGTITVADYRARTGQQPESLDGTPLADDALLHWVAMTLEIGDALKPPAGNYWLWTKITDAPETIPRRTSGRITIT